MGPGSRSAWPRLSGTTCCAGTAMENRHCERSEAIQNASQKNSLDCFVALLLAMTYRPHHTPPHSRGEKSPELCIIVSLKNRGRRECRALGQRPRPRVRNEKSTRDSHHRSAKQSGIPCANGFNGFFRALPGDRAFLPPSPCETTKLDASVEASGPHDLAVRLTRVRLFAPKASTASPPNVRDDRETPLWIGHGMGRILPVIWQNDQLRPPATD